ncbi:cytochrome P450 [Crucibulum laeve]|uniref:Cytochrome P450 n=1 Tax=Crucibulum laeve TaxID=68775 RepID=A0A5C3LY68_9AGAR|nr:cytochrome P450 [Crucibulum laeve]
MDQLLIAGFCVCALTVVLRYGCGRRSVDDIASLPGPPSSSWLYGNLPELLLDRPYGSNGLKWLAEYGPVHRIRGCFGENRLMVSDPVALRYILANFTTFGKSPTHRFLNPIAFGSGSLLHVTGEQHHRIRGIMNAMFSATNVRGLAPILEKAVLELIERWRSEPIDVVDVYRAMHDTTLQAVGEGVMGYNIRENENYARTYRNLVQAEATLSKAAILADAVLCKFPYSLLNILTLFPSSDIQKLVDHRHANVHLSNILLESKLETLKLESEADNDLFSILVQKNSEASSPMSADEIKDQVGTLTVAGEETTANSLVWALYVLAQNPQWQETIRQEINHWIANHSDRAVDYDQLPFLNAIIKEVLRFYSPLPHADRYCTQDAIVPLSEPIITAGKVLTSLRVKKGTYVTVAISTFHRLTSIWGPDAHEFKPSRWLRDEEVSKSTSLGPYSNLLSFFSGPRVCIGWRFAILETQIILSHLVRNFIFSLLAGSDVQPGCAITLVPMDADGKANLYLHVSPL